MTRASRKSLVAAAIAGALLSTVAANAQDAPPVSRAAQPPASVNDQVVVTGQAINQLRLRIRLSEDAVYARFNEINSDDRFDIHCELRPDIGSHIQQRVCVSNAWKQEEANYAAAMLAQQLREYGPVPELFRARQLADQSVLNEEFRRLSSEDSAFRDSLVRLGRAYLALDLLRGTHTDHTLFHEVPAGDRRLPADAQHMFDVRIGPVPWTYTLTERTFTIAAVSGHIKGMRTECERGGKSLKFQDDAEWTLPAAWGRCRLTVYAKRDTTFAFFEFEAAPVSAAPSAQ